MQSVVSPAVERKAFFGKRLRVRHTAALFCEGSAQTRRRKKRSQIQSLFQRLFGHFGRYPAPSQRIGHLRRTQVDHRPRTRCAHEQHRNDYARKKGGQQTDENPLTGRTDTKIGSFHFPDIFS